MMAASPPPILQCGYMEPKPGDLTSSGEKRRGSRYLSGRGLLLTLAQTLFPRCQDPASGRPWVTAALRTWDPKTRQSSFPLFQLLSDRVMGLFW